MNMRKLKLIFYGLFSLLVVGCSEEQGDGYLELEGISYFYSVVLQEGGALKMQLTPVDAPAIYHYKTKEEQVFILNIGDEVRIAYDKDKRNFFEFRYLNFQNGFIYGTESYSGDNDLSGRKFKVKFREYPKIHVRS